MARKVVIIDYGSGNLHSAAKAFERAGAGLAEISVSSDPKTLADASHIVLPGVGAFADCKAGLAAVPGMVEALEREVRERKKPFFGICVGMQLLATTGLEHGEHTGLGWIPGTVKKLEASGLKIPHMGWNTLALAPAPATASAMSLSPSGTEGGGLLASHATPPLYHSATHPLLAGVDGKDVYFVHSYHFVPENAGHVVATVEYGGPVVAALAHENIFGTQFHPEKSQAAGLQLIQNFIKWMP